MKRLASLSMAAAMLAAALVATAQDISEEARKHMIRGRTAVEMAKSPQEYRFAVEEFQKAVELAPSWAEAYYNLGMAQAELGELKAAKANLERYLALAPQAPDAAKVREDIVKLEYRLEREQRLQALAGEWLEVHAEELPAVGPPWRMRWEGSRLILERTEDRTLFGRVDVVNELLGGLAPMESFGQGSVTERFEFEAQGLALQGWYLRPAFVEKKSGCTVPAERAPAQGQIDPERQRLELRYRFDKYKVGFSDPFPGLKRCTGVNTAGSEERTLRLRQAPPKPVLGIEFGAFPGRPGLLIVKVLPDSPAARAGILQGDRLLAIDGKSVNGLDPKAVAAMVRESAGRTVALTILREAWGETPRDIAVPLGKL